MANRSRKPKQELIRIIYSDSSPIVQNLNCISSIIHHPSVFFTFIRSTQYFLVFSPVIFPFAVVPPNARQSANTYSIMLFDLLIDAWHYIRDNFTIAFICATGLCVQKFFTSSSEKGNTQDGSREKSFMEVWAMTFVMCLQ